MIFNENDDAILNTLTDDNQKIEPEFYVPSCLWSLLTELMVSGLQGWMTKILTTTQEIVGQPSGR